MSDTPIAERLQVKRDRTLALVDAPGAIDAAIGAFRVRTDVATAHVVLLFAADRAALDAAIPKLLPELKADVILWIAYPKLTSPLAADLSRDILHQAMPAMGLDACSQIALDADWSAMRFKRI